MAGEKEVAGEEWRTREERNASRSGTRSGRPAVASKHNTCTHTMYIQSSFQYYYSIYCTCTIAIGECMTPMTSCNLHYCIDKDSYYEEGTFHTKYVHLMHKWQCMIAALHGCCK